MHLNKGIKDINYHDIQTLFASENYSTVYKVFYLDIHLPYRKLLSENRFMTVKKCLPFSFHYILQLVAPKIGSINLASKVTKLLIMSGKANIQLQRCVEVVFIILQTHAEFR